MKEPLRLPLEEAKAVYDEKQVTVVDVVDAGAYPHVAHEVRGAERINPDDIEEAYGRLRQEHTILTYCTCDNDEISAKVAYFLRKQEYSAYAIEGGLPAWRQAGYPVQEKEVVAQAQAGD
jgi:rhodanese-related sulfurtransferase